MHPDRAAPKDSATPDWHVSKALTLAEQTAQMQMSRMIEAYGANAAIRALARALERLGPEWRGENGAAIGVEAVTGYSPCRADDWQKAARW